ncbi:hypothetical protein L6452_26777 [Arctium lappa]|uniref:Uncharacterized protein n=1 Tax=Arctium lappa TaxID=4217 RepID=A0ACB8ZVM2_ARCLA|nr:hypothetical protein L6452_26777 [Arctium lappa]
MSSRQDEKKTLRQLLKKVAGSVGLQSTDNSGGINDKDSAQVKPEEEEETKDNDPSTKTNTKGNDAGSHSEKRDKIIELRRATMHGWWDDVEKILKNGKDLETEPLNGEGNTVLHIAIGIDNYGFIEKLLEYIIKKENSENTIKSDSSALRKKNSNGNTALHIAAIVGNRAAAELLVKGDEELLKIGDENEKKPLFKAYSNMQFDTFIYLLDQATKDETKKAKDETKKANDETKKAKDETMEDISKDNDYIPMGVKLLVNAISAKKYSTASKLVEKFAEFVEKSDDVLMAIARTFPNGLGYWETLICPCSLSDIGKRIVEKLGLLFSIIFYCLPFHLCDTREESLLVPILVHVAVVVPMMMVAWVYCLLSFLIYMVYLPFYFVYFLWWKVAARLKVPPVKDILEKKKEWDEAKRLLELVCNKIDDYKPKDSSTPNHIYYKPILEAARQNAYQVFDEILSRSPDVIQSTDENGYDFIQLAVIHRSEKIYNLIYQIGERKNHYGTFKDSSENNILHLVGRLAPSHELNCRTGAALQLQRELQWREEVKTLVFPAYITEENIFKETPAMVFTREHKDLVREGEKWMKTTAESCSITAGLITTIVFAAAITVPGGSNQETGIPLFTNDIAFIIFAASDAISLFASTTALLVFLSILTARFAEQDFLISLPRRLIIGFCALLLSTTAMMVSFSAILYLVFCDKRSWMIGLICGLASIPIACFVALQFSLIVDLHRSTYVRIFGPKTNWRKSRFDSRLVQSYFK